MNINVNITAYEKYISGLYPIGLRTDVVLLSWVSSGNIFHHKRIMLYLIMYITCLVEHMIARWGFPRSHTTLQWSALGTCVSDLFCIRVTSYPVQ